MERKEQIFETLIISGITFFAAGFYFFTDARYSAVFPKCPFFGLTGYLCPGCGAQRGISSLLHGNVIQAMHDNLLLVAGLPVVISVSVVNVLNFREAQKFIQRLIISTSFVQMAFGVVMLFWFLRNIPVYPFTLLAPQ